MKGAIEMTTKGEWRMGFARGQEYPIYADDNYEIARAFIHNGEQEANARLIVSAANACAKINPNNPQAVAEGIGELYEALKGILLVARPADEHAKMVFEKTYQGVFEVLGNRLETAAEALSSVKGERR